jgi:hypothetical protein
MGAWNPKSAAKMTTDANSFPIWRSLTYTVDKPDIVEYKYIIVDEQSGEVSWENGDNRIVDLTTVEARGIIIEDDGWDKT